MDPDIGTIEAIAIDGDTIIALGSASEIDRYRGADTTVVELDGRTVNPGFVDAHTHILSDMGGIEAGRQLALAENAAARGDALAEYVGRVRVAGFFAYAMAREGIELLRLTAAAAGLEQAVSDTAGPARPGAVEEADRALRHLEEIGPLLQQTLRDMEPYRELDSAQTLEKIAARLAGGQRPPSGG